MTVREIIEHTDRVKPNAFSPEDKLIWLNELEYAVQTDVFGMTEGFSSHSMEGACTDAPLIPEPYHKVYPAYLEARIDAANGEWDEYDNAMALFNGFLGEFQRWYARNHIDNEETRADGE